VALTQRLAATALAGAVAVPIEPIPGIDAVYDFAVPILLIGYRFTLFRDARRVTPIAFPTPNQATVDRNGR